MVASNLSRVKTIVVMVAIVIGLSQGPIGVEGQAQCRGLDVGGLISKCGKYLQKTGPKIPPSSACCGVVKNMDIPCACRYVNKDVEKLLNVDKVVYVARYCGVALKHGSKCGSFSIP